MKLSIEKLKPGLVLGSDVARDRVVLLAAGTELTPQHLSMLAAWKIDFVDVVRPAEERAAAAAVNYPPEVLAAAEERVNLRFKHVGLTHPAVGAIRDLAVRRVAGQLARRPQSGRGGGV